MIHNEITSRGKHHYLYLREFTTGALSIDLVKHHDEMPMATHLAAPRARTHTHVTDMLILKWYDVHGPESAWPIAMHLGGETEGYTDAWVLQRYCWILDQLSNAEHEEATPAPMLVAEAVPVVEPEPEPELVPEPPEPPVTPTPPPTEATATRPPTPEKMDEPQVTLVVRPSGRRSWTPEADEKITAWITKNGQNWRALARHMGGRKNGYSDDAVRNRYMRIHGIKSTKGRFIRATPARGPKWDAHEDQVITQLYDAEQHNRWTHIASLLGTDRTPAAVRLRAQRLGLFEYRGKPDPDSD